MNKINISLIAHQFRKNTFQSGAVYPLLTVFMLLVIFAAVMGYKNYTIQEHIREEYQQMARNSWENNPDKHPHRMAHFGSFAFRTKHPLSMFDLGMENFTGNAVFLEAHKQNTVNFSEAGFSTGLMRFGDISLSMLLQVVLPLIVFFLGFNAIASERENGTLKILLSQGAAWKDILLGKTFGLFSVALFFIIPVAIVTGVLLMITEHVPDSKVLLRAIILLSGYILFYWVICVITVVVSTFSRTSKGSLLKLLGIWLFLVILLPKTLQAAGSYVYPSPSRLAFEEAVEKDIIKLGDSHNPDDPHYKAIKDSLLRVYGVDSVQQLPFNYSGYIGKEGERLSSETYNQHLIRLVKIYEQQNGFSKSASVLNPFAAQKHISMALSGTGFDACQSFQQQAEEYRYSLAQKMNTLQAELISNKKLGEDEKPYSISRKHWKDFPDFRYSFLPVKAIITVEWFPLLCLSGWFIFSFLLVHLVSQKAKVV